MIRRWVPTLVLGGLWWWAVLRLALQPEQAGVVEGAVAAGGWGLSLLPVHVAAVGGGRSAGRTGVGSGSASGSGSEAGPGSGSVETDAGRAGPDGDSAGWAGPVRAGAGGVVTGWLRAISGPGRERRRDRGWWGAGVTRAWRRRRSGGGSGRS
ncbi:hypothetical protein CVT27_26040 [Streptomyces cavourensis]|nr:hypothetical protein CVT27_26040 [Streptomyces cavourensis]